MSAQFLTKIPKPVAILLLGGLLIAAVATLKPAPQPRAEAPISRPQVNVMAADPRPQRLTVRSQGTVKPRREIDLVAQVAGNVTAVTDQFVDGGFFSEGKSLVQIDSRDYQLALIQAQARVAEAAQALASERGRARQAKREWRDLGNAEANDLFLRKPQLAAAEAQLASAEADRDQAQLNLQRTSITIPFAGRIRETFVDLGQYVSPGTRIASVYDTSVAEIRLPLTDRQAALLDLPLGSRSNDTDHPGPAVTISGVIAGQPYQWQGRIVRTDASIDTRSRLYYAVAEVEAPFLVNPDSAQLPLMVGLFVEAQIQGRQLGEVVSLPREALFKRDHLYVLDADNRVRHKRVTVLASEGNRVWVKGDLSPGESIVVGQQSLLSEGVAVMPLPMSTLVAGG